MPCRCWRCSCNARYEAAAEKGLARLDLGPTAAATAATAAAAAAGKLARTLRTLPPPLLLQQHPLFLLPAARTQDTSGPSHPGLRLVPSSAGSTLAACALGDAGLGLSPWANLPPCSTLRAHQTRCQQGTACRTRPPPHPTPPHPTPPDTLARPTRARSKGTGDAVSQFSIDGLELLVSTGPPTTSAYFEARSTQQSAPGDPLGLTTTQAPLLRGVQPGPVSRLVARNVTQAIVKVRISRFWGWTCMNSVLPVSKGYWGCCCSASVGASAALRVRSHLISAAAQKPRGVATQPSGGQVKPVGHARAPVSAGRRRADPLNEKE